MRGNEREREESVGACGCGEVKRILSLCTQTRI